MTAIVLALAPAAADAATPPTVAVTGISAGQTVAGTVALSVNATDDVGVTQVKWVIDNVEAGWDGTPPWLLNWNSTRVANGPHTIFAKAADAAGAWGNSAAVSFTVANPTVSVSSPAAGSTVSGSVTLAASGTNLSGVTQMKWYIDGTEAGADSAAPWEASWNSALLANGAHSVVVKALAANGTWVTSPTVSFNVQNATLPAPKWQLLMSEDFNGTAVDTTKWKVYGPNWVGNAGNGLRDGRAISVQDGILTVTAQMLNGTLVSGGVQSRIDQRYGRYEFRVRTDPDPSAATSGVVLTWPQSGNWPTDGENDIYEAIAGSRTPFASFIHYGSSNQQYWYHHNADGTQWHTIAMEWEPDAIRIYRDGALAWTLTDAVAIPDVAHHLDIQLDAIKKTMTGSVRMQVDWVRIYSRAA